MAILMIEYRLPTEAVPDYAAWKEVFDPDPVGRRSHGATRHWIYQAHRDPNHFMFSLEFETIDEAESFLNQPMLKQSWEVSGAGSAWLLEEAESFSYGVGKRRHWTHGGRSMPRILSSGITSSRLFAIESNGSNFLSLVFDQE
jgi:hypothetical protein